jgi:signal transduction histidine kinase
MSSLIRATLQEFEPRIKSIDGVVEMYPNLPRVMGDVTLLQQIFANLIDNALTYRKPDERLRLQISWREMSGDVVITVADNGIGISPEYHRRIFEVFQRLHPNEVYPGTGIGLATVERAVEKLNGSVSVESELGKGSAFHVRLKAAR